MPLGQLPLVPYLGVVAGLALLGIWACGRTARDLAVADPSVIVWDETVGYLVAMAGLPQTWAWAAAGFALFRVLDIVKPGPIGWLERSFRGGLGIMLDDLAAGAVTCAALALAWVLLGG